MREESMHLEKYFREKKRKKQGTGNIHRNNGQ